MLDAGRVARRDRLPQPAAVDHERRLATATGIESGADFQLLGVELTLRGPELEATLHDLHATLRGEHAMPSLHVQVQGSAGRSDARGRLTREQFVKLWIERRRIQAQVRG